MSGQASSQLLSVPSPSSSPTPEPYIVNLTDDERIAFTEEYNTYLIDNLETLLIGHTTPTKWPQQIKAAIADTIIHGRFKYHDDDHRTHRIIHNSTLTLGTVRPITPLPRDTQSEARAAVIHDAFCAALNYFVSENIFELPLERLVEVYAAASDLKCPVDPETPSHLGDIATVIRDVVTLSIRRIKHVVDILLTAITGMPCLKHDLDREEKIIGSMSDRHSRDVKNYANRIILYITYALSEAFFPIIAAPRRRWNLAQTYKVDYLHKRSFTSGHHIADYDVLQTLSKIDLAHAVLETGVSCKMAGKKICFVAPYSLTLLVTQAIADVHSNEAGVEVARWTIGQKDVVLANPDREDMEASDPHPQYGRWTSLLLSSFSRAALADFVSREGVCHDRVAANRHGDVLFFVRGFGPWMASMEDSIIPETTAELLYHTVQGYRMYVPGGRRFRWMSPDEQITTGERRSTQFKSDRGKNTIMFHECKYKPRTLNRIVNRPGRVLVKRGGLRGSASRFVVAGILASGAVTVVNNFAGRDNWLEIAFDGAHVMTLAAGLVVSLGCLVTGSLTSTLDWLRHVMEVTDDEQLSQALGASLNEIKVACSYETEGCLFWLSDVNSGFCPARKSGEMVFTRSLDMELMSPHVSHGCVIGKDSGLWILQGWAFRIEKRGEVGHMVKVPYEDRVYVNDGELRTFD